MLSGRLEEARQLAQRAHEWSRAYKERRCEAYALHLLGEIATHGEPADIAQAEARYQQALANELGMRPLAAY